MLKYNADEYWSSFYHNRIQYTDGRHIMSINWDDAAGIHMDTMATHRLYIIHLVHKVQSVIQLILIMSISTNIFFKLHHIISAKLKPLWKFALVLLNLLDCFKSILLNTFKNLKC